VRELTVGDEDDTKKKGERRPLGKGDRKKTLGSRGCFGFHCNILATGKRPKNAGPGGGRDPRPSEVKMNETFAPSDQKKRELPTRTGEFENAKTSRLQGPARLRQSGGFHQPVRLRPTADGYHEMPAVSIKEEWSAR